MKLHEALLIVGLLIITTIAISFAGDINNKPPVQVNSDWSASSGVAQIINKPIIMTYAYEDVNNRSNSFWITANATVGATSAVYQLTSDGTSTGTALCTNGVIVGSVQPVARDATLPYSYGTPVVSNSNRTLTIPVNKSSGILTVLSLSVLGAPVVATGSSVDMAVMCY